MNNNHFSASVVDNGNQYDLTWTQRLTLLNEKIIYWCDECDTFHIADGKEQDLWKYLGVKVESGIIDETPFGEQLDGGFGDAEMAQFDDDPNPYHGDYSEN